jgi:hypothetical protein
MSVILDIDLDYFGLVEQPIAELERLLTWAGRSVDFVVEQHHEAYTRWKQMVTARVVRPPHLIIHADEHHDMMSETPPANFGSFLYFAMRHWPNCRVVWVTPQPIDYPDMWLSDDAWEAVSSRFECATRFRRQWPKPDVVSVCISPDFVDARLSQRLLEKVEDCRDSFRPKMPPQVGRASRRPASPLSCWRRFGVREKERLMAVNSRLHGVISATSPNTTINHTQAVAVCY